MRANEAYVRFPGSMIYRGSRLALNDSVPPVCRRVETAPATSVFKEIVNRDFKSRGDGAKFCRR